MILVIFGAGASYDSCPSFPVKGSNPGAVRNQTPERPPLAAELFYNNDIFSDALREYWECNPIVPYLREISGGIPFEQALDKLQEESTTDPIRTKQLTAVRFYLKNMLYRCEGHWSGRTRGITNYLTLMDQLRRSSTASGPITLVTFNYDRLLDQALHHFNINVKAVDDYINNDKVKLFKLHGSINWGRKIKSLKWPTTIDLKNIPQVAHYIIDKSPELDVSHDYVFEGDQGPSYPALAIPVINKQNFECPDNHVDRLRQIVRNTDKILVIGWRAAEKHFLDLIKSNLTRDISVESVCGRQEYSQDTLTALEKHGIEISGKAFDGGFTEYVKSREAERFFS